MGRYSPRHHLDVSGLRESAPTAQDQRNEDESDLLRFVGDIAPAAGTALGIGGGALIGGLLGAPTGPGAAATALGGAALGAPIGGALGSAAGQMFGAGAHGMAEDKVSDREDEEANKADRRMAMLEVLSSLRH